MERNRLVLVYVMLCGLSSALGCGAGKSSCTTGGNYPPVTNQKLSGATYNHRTGQDEPAMDWQFTDGQMKLVTKEEALPTELVDAILGEDSAVKPRTVKQITASWSIKGETLTMDEIRYDDNRFDGSRTLRIFNTGVIRIEAGGDQYVFSPAGR